jgi:hypothetical protein
MEPRCPAAGCFPTRRGRRVPTTIRLNFVKSPPRLSARATRRANESRHRACREAAHAAVRSDCTIRPASRRRKRRKRPTHLTTGRRLLWQEYPADPRPIGKYHRAAAPRPPWLTEPEPADAWDVCIQTFVTAAGRASPGSRDGRPRKCRRRRNGRCLPYR